MTRPTLTVSRPVPDRRLLATTATPVTLEHRTSYRYDRPVWLSPHVVRLRPAPHTRTPIHDYQQRVTPEDHEVAWQQDPFGNHVARYVFTSKADALDVVVRLTADLTPINPFDFLLEPQASEWPVPYEPAVARGLLAHLETDQASMALHEFLAEVRALTTPGRPTTDVLVDCNQLVHDRLDYEERTEQGVQSPDETLERGIASCRDSSWLLVHVLRNLGMAARFTSGYLLQLATDDPDDDGPDEDTAALHAWAEVYLPGGGWVGLDPTSGLLVTEGHIPLAATTEPSLAAPVSGTTDPAEVEFSYASSLTREPPDAGSAPT